MITFKTFIAVWLIVIIICALEAYFCTKFDPESEEYIRKRDNNDLRNR